MKAAFYTLGCKVNSYETEVNIEKFKERRERSKSNIILNIRLFIVIGTIIINHIVNSHTINSSIRICSFACISHFN